MKLHKSVYLLALILLSSCGTSVYTSDSNYVEGDRKYSPDQSKMILNYRLDQGALGYAGRTAILKVTDLNKNLAQYNLDRDLEQLEWIDNDTISAKINVIPLIRKGKPATVSDREFNGVKIKVSPYDFIEKDYHIDVEHRETSPDGTKELVAYRYLKDRNSLNFIHVSVINKNEPFPRYGNYFIADLSSDYILSGTWNKDGSLLFYSNSLYADKIQYFLVNNRPDIKYNVVVDEARFENKYRWIRS